MLAAERRAFILAELDRDGIVKVSDLVDLLGVSDMTVRRDLTALQHEGFLQKVHGGARVRSEPAATAEPGFQAKSSRRLLYKEAIAARAADLVQPGSAIAVSAGTTTHLFARHLATIPDLTVVTNSVWVADVLHRSEGDSISVLLTGGMRTPSDALVGPLATAALRSLHLDMTFLGVHGMNPRAGFNTPNLLEAETNRAMVLASTELVVLADSTKWGVAGLSSMARLDEATVVVTDDELAAEGQERLAASVGELILVSAGLTVPP